MNQLRTAASLVLLCVAGVCSACGGDDSRSWQPATGASGGSGGSGGSVDPRYRPLAEALEIEMQVLGTPGVAVAIIEGGEITWARGFGRKHPEQSDPVEATTLFRIASVTKMLTAAALLQQVEQGQVELDAPLTDTLPDFGFAQDASWAPSIQVEHLLTHGSAIYDHLLVDAPPSEQTDDALATYVHGTFGELAWLMAPAGRMYNYSNPNFMLAGLITETLSDQYYRAYLDEHLLTPLGMDRTFLLPEEVLADGDFASGQTLHWETGEPTVAGPDAYDCAWGRPAAFAFSSVLDLAEFVLFLRDGDQSVLGADQHQAMQQAQRDTEFLHDIAQYGYGLAVDSGLFVGGTSFYELTHLHHDGAMPGFAADLHFFPELDFGFITLANTDLAYFSYSLGVALQTLCELPASSTPPELGEDPANYDRYAGTYQDLYDLGPIIVSRQGDSLELSLPDLDLAGVPYEPMLQPYTPGTFVLRIQGYGFPVTFILDDQGQGEYFRNRYFVGTRVDALSGSRSQPSSIQPVAPAVRRARIERLLRRAHTEAAPWPLGLQPSQAAALRRQKR